MSYRFFGELINGEVRLQDDDIFHLTKVLRIKPHEEIEVVASGKLYRTKVASFTPFNLTVFSEEQLNNELDYTLTLIYVQPKRDKFELALEKAVELGVTKIIVTTSAYSVVKIKESRSENKLIRYNKIIKSAAMQAKRDAIPELIFIPGFTDALQAGSGVKIIASEHEQEATFSSHLKTPSDVTIVIGSEGGFKTEEVTLAADLGYSPVTFGPLILRTETSVIYALSIINNFLRGAK
ncbi:MAG TPA: RsmE family RNA methyltransferase [Bacilli bacterium]|nr:RsmE family RNA methyltransferase [Bacilli bacterium]